MAHYGPVPPPDAFPKAPALGPDTHVYPWRRYFGRVLDLTLFSSLLNGALAFLGISIHYLVMSLIAMAVYQLAVEPVLLSTWGSTPGKWILGIHLTDSAGGKLIYGIAFKRSLRVWYAGLACGIPIVNWITELVCKSNLENHGHTSWDYECGCKVTHEQLVWWRVIAWLAAYILLPIGLGASAGLGQLLLEYINLPW